MYWNYWFSPSRVREPEEGGGEVTAREGMWKERRREFKEKGRGGRRIHEGGRKGRHEQVGFVNRDWLQREIAGKRGTINRAMKGRGKYKWDWRKER